MAYVLKWSKHTDPATGDSAPAGEWLMSEGDPPLNVLRNTMPSGVPVVEITQDPHHARAHVKAVREAWELRQAAAKKVAGS